MSEFQVGQVVEHDGKLYRITDRAARIGDYVIITSNNMDGEDHFGEIHRVIDLDGLIDTTGHWSDGSTLNPGPSEYRVLEPIETGPHDTYEAIANLAVKVAQIEKKLDAPTRAEFLEIIRRAEEMHHERMTLILRVFSELGAKE